MTIDQRKAAWTPANNEEEGDYDDDIGELFDGDAGALEEEEVDVEEDINVLAEGDVEGETYAKIDDAVLETFVDPPWQLPKRKFGATPHSNIERDDLAAGDPLTKGRFDVRPTLGVKGKSEVSRKAGLSTTAKYYRFSRPRKRRNI